MTIKYTNYEMYLRRHILTTLMNHFNDNRAIYECADEWMEKFYVPHRGIMELYKASHDVIDYYNTYYAK